MGRASSDTLERPLSLYSEYVNIKFSAIYFIPPLYFLLNLPKGNNASFNCPDILFNHIDILQLFLIECTVLILLIISFTFTFSGYNAWRTWCGLKPATDFEDLVEIEDSIIIERFRGLYK